MRTGCHTEVRSDELLTEQRRKTDAVGLPPPPTPEAHQPPPRPPWGHRIWPPPLPARRTTLPFKRGCESPAATMKKSIDLSGSTGIGRSDFKRGKSADHCKLRTERCTCLIFQNPQVKQRNQHAEASMAT
jgi:hypothetical protein